MYSVEGLQRFDAVGHRVGAETHFPHLAQHDLLVECVILGDKDSQTFARLFRKPLPTIGRAEEEKVSGTFLTAFPPLFSSQQHISFPGLQIRRLE